MRRLLALWMVLVLFSCAPAFSIPTEGETVPKAPLVQLQPLPEPELEPEQECESEPVVAHLVVAGDVMCHNPINTDAYVKQTGEYDYSHMFQAAAPQIAQADYAVANLETVFAGGVEYSGYPTFNTPDALAKNLRDAGFDLVSTANNHTRDKGVQGIFRTLDVLDEAGLAHVGTYRTQEEREASSGVYVADVGGISVAFLCYTYGLNGFRLDQEYKYAVNLFNLDYYTTLANPDYDLVRADLEAARALDTDLIAVLIHWGNEYKDKQNSHQENMARFLVEQGADLVLGGHPHVLEPYETITVEGWDGQERQGFVCYSLGNFISNQLELKTMTTVVLDLELTKNPDGGTSLTDVSYTPYYMLHRRSTPGDRRYLVDIHKSMAEFEEGESTLIDKSAYGRLQSALDHCHAILGAEGDQVLRQRDDAACRALVGQYAQTVYAQDADRYIALFTRENRQEMERFLAHYGADHFFQEKRVFISRLDRDSLSPAEREETAAYERAAAYFMERKTGETDRVLFALEDGSWRIVRISAISA
ncbi:MAG: hypothetical protein HFF50_03000 [Lawsonibacter sp.]|nr:hypothetical protein [Lawsonibacter sp.]